MDQIFERREKPVDRWLGLGGIAVGITFYLLPKTPLVVMSSLILIFALLIHPIWHFWWVERKLWRKLLATLFFVLGLLVLGQNSWPSESGTLMQVLVHLIEAFWKWLTGIQSRWFDRLIGAGYLATAIVIWMLVRMMFNARRLRSKEPIQKGFLDHKLDAETAMEELPAILAKLTAIMVEEGPSIDRHTGALQRATSTAQQLKVSRAASSSLDRYSARVDRVRVKFAEIGESLSNGLTGWSQWIEETRPSKVVLADLADGMREFSGVLNRSNDQLRTYIDTICRAKGSSSVLDAAIDKHIRTLQVILNSNIRIHDACDNALRIIDNLA